jgi:CheY-like chemotaxis protein/two-component sensor histidine kinase
MRAQMEKQSKLDADLERATRLESLGVLAGGIAHDFNNLLTVIIANLGIAAMDSRVQEAAGEILADAERGAQRAAELTQQLLTFAKGGDPVRQAVALPDIVRESAEFARHGSLVRCVVEVEPNLPPANVDRGQISRVVHNLVLNATQAMPDGGVVRLNLSAVTVREHEEPNLNAGRYIKLSISDEGHGIPPEYLKRIFEPYFSTKPKNNGLGLATVHSIVKRHQGHIRVRSELGVGTTFDIWLPTAKEAVTDVLPTMAPTVAPRRRLRVLFMDDDDIIRRTAATILQQLGHDAKIVSDGMDVVREYETALHAGSKYDVVVLDLTVPGGLGGRAAMEILRRIDPNVRGIVSSGYSNDPVLANHRAYGFAAVVPKPYVVDDLARAIQEVAAARPEVGATSAATSV